ncbi:hypothetical protein CEXT_688561 [Caerostris extrusa]|uniref:Uncharacterized protein n=1 Tax=Caerostris extrusa TaxID=172846 RepID=A0AAV4SRV3_CAEEX|nr:hypothetical protein CEXT_688561 [Caerostris extrusa]
MMLAIFKAGKMGWRQRSSAQVCVKNIDNCFSSIDARKMPIVMLLSECEMASLHLVTWAGISQQPAHKIFVPFQTYSANKCNVRRPKFTMAV